MSFDLLHFEPLTWKGFLRRYVGAIQPQVVWWKIKNPRMGLRLLQPGEVVSMPWYRRGDWRDGEPHKMAPGKTLALARVPAVLWKERLVVLDGCHRLSEVRPALVLVDFFVPKASERVYVTDLFNSRHFS